MPSPTDGRFLARESKTVALFCLLAARHEGSSHIGGHSAQMLEGVGISSIAAPNIRVQQDHGLLIVLVIYDVAAKSNTFIADEDRWTSDQGSDFVLVLAAA
jgi:hypothetical protein